MEEKEKEEVKSIRVDLTPEEYKALKGYAEKRGLKTKTYTEFFLKSFLREAKENKETLFQKLKNLF